jgi:hypothetical protein
MLIVRSGKPSRYDQLPYGAICQALTDPHSDNFEIYVQMNQDDRIPRWEKVGVFSPETQQSIMEEVNKIFNMKKVS